MERLLKECSSLYESQPVYDPNRKVWYWYYYPENSSNSHELYISRLPEKRVPQLIVSFVDKNIMRNPECMEEFLEAQTRIKNTGTFLSPRSGKTCQING